MQNLIISELGIAPIKYKHTLTLNRNTCSCKNITFNQLRSTRRWGKSNTSPENQQRNTVAVAVRVRAGGDVTQQRPTDNEAIST